MILFCFFFEVLTVHISIAGIDGGGMEELAVVGVVVVAEG